MKNADKFAKNLDDEQLDEVAGCTIKEIAKDIQFLNKVGKDDGVDIPSNVDLSTNAGRAKFLNAWTAMDIYVDVDRKTNNCTYYKEFHGEKISRQDAMIIAMRNSQKVVDLDDYL